MKLVELFDKLAACSKAADKEALLKANHTDTLDQIMHDCYDSVRYNIRPKQINVPCYGTASLDKNYLHVHNLLKDLAARKYTGNDAVEVVEQLFSKFDEQSVSYLLKLLDRNLKIGVTLTQYNKWFGIKETKFEVPLAHHYDKVTGVNVLDGSYYASRKLDGVRLWVDIDMDEKNVVFRSRSGKEYTTLSNLKQPVLNVMKGKHGQWCLDGECCIIKENGEDDFQGVMKQIRRKNYTIPDPHYCIFDMVPKSVADGIDRGDLFHDRYAAMQKLPKDSHIQLLEQELVTDEKVFAKWRQKVIDGNWEGFMFRKDTYFTKGRSKDLLKYKPYTDDEYVVKDIIVGKQTWSGPDGHHEEDGVTALIIEHKGCDVRVGTGLSMEQRIDWFAHPEHVIGKTVTIKYLEETQDQNGKWSLRHPVLKWKYEGERDV